MVLIATDGRSACICGVREIDDDGFRRPRAERSRARSPRRPRDSATDADRARPRRRRGPRALIEVDITAREDAGRLIRRTDRVDLDEPAADAESPPRPALPSSACCSVRPGRRQHRDRGSSAARRRRRWAGTSSSSSSSSRPRIPLPRSSGAALSSTLNGGAGRRRTGHAVAPSAKRSRAQSACDGHLESRTVIAFSSNGSTGVSSSFG